MRIREKRRSAVRFSAWNERTREEKWKRLPRQRLPAWELTFISEQLMDRLGAVINQGKRARLRSWEVGFEIQAEAVEDGRNDFRWFDGTLDRVTADFVALTDDTPAFDTAAREIYGPALRPMVTAPGWIDFRRSAKFS